MALTELPSELLAEIGTWCTVQDRKSLRETAFRVCSALDFLLFSDFTLILDLHTMFRTHERDSLVYALASRKTCIGSYAQNLRVKFMSNSQPPNGLDSDQKRVRTKERWARFRQDLLSALASFTNVTVASITFDVHMKAMRSVSGGQSLIRDLFSGLQGIQRLENVSLVFCTESIPTLSAFSQLHGLHEFHLIASAKLKSRTVERALGEMLTNSPNLSQLTLDGTYPAEKLDRIFQHLPPGHFRHLRHMEINNWILRKSVAMYTNLHSLSNLILHQCDVHPGFWDGLREHEIFILSLELTLSVGEDLAVLHYLESNRKLEDLTLSTSFRWDSPNLSVVDDLAKYFWLRVIPRCAPHLKHLHIVPQAHGKWSYCDFSRDSVRLCVELQSLSICVATDHFPNNDMISLIDSTKRLRCLRILRVVQARTSERLPVPVDLDASIKQAVEEYTVKKGVAGFDAMQGLELRLAGNASYKIQPQKESDEAVWKFQAITVEE